MKLKLSLKSATQVMVIILSTLTASFASAAVWQCQSIDSNGISYWGSARTHHHFAPRQTAVNRSFDRCKSTSRIPGSCRFINCSKQYRRAFSWRCTSYNRRGFQFTRTHYSRRHAVHAALNACYRFPSRHCRISRCSRVYA